MTINELTNSADYDRRRALQAVSNAKEAIKRGDRLAARHFSEAAIQQDPTLEDPWLCLAAIASPQASLAYLQKALEINPSSMRAMKGMEWALRRLKTAHTIPVEGDKSADDEEHRQDHPQNQEHPFSSDDDQFIYIRGYKSKKKGKDTPFIVWYAFGTLLFALIFLGFALWPFYPQLWMDLSNSSHPIIDEMMEKLRDYSVLFGIGPTAPNPGQTIGTAISFEPPTGVISTGSPTPYQPVTSTPTELPSPTPTVTPIPTEMPLPSPTLTTEPTISVTASIQPTVAELTLQPTRKPKKKNPSTAGPGLRPEKVTLSDRWLDVDLSSQQAFAMEGSEVARSFIVSTGRWPNVTVTGTYKIYVKYRSANMSGEDYFLANVPYVMYFFKGYGFHGTYWHNNFGTPMSHGCVNLQPEDAAWLYDFASVGTIVSIHQ